MFCEYTYLRKYDKIPVSSNESEVVPMNYSEIIGHEITPAAAAVLDKITAHVERTHAAHPEIPVTAIWDKVIDAVQRAIDESRAEE